MRIAHVAVWVSDVDESAAFWTEYFGAIVGPVYESKRRPGFRSRFAVLPQEGGQIELMSGPWVSPGTDEDRMGWAHIALSLGSEAAVDMAAVRLGAAGFLLEGPRRTGDGYYEAVARAPDGALIEITS